MASQYDAYRDDILAWKAQGMKKIDIFKELQRSNPGLKQTAFYDYLEKLEEETANQATQRFLSEIIDSLSQVHSTMNAVLQAVKENDEEAARRHEQLMKQPAPAPQLHTPPPSQMYTPPPRMYVPPAAPPQRISWRLPRIVIPAWVPKPLLGLLLLLAAFVVVHALGL